MVRRSGAIWPQLWRREEASVSLLAAGVLATLIGMSALAVDLNRGYEQRMVNQRVADVAALAAATAYRAAGSAAILQPTATDLVIANGLADTTVEATLLEDYPASGQKAVRVRLTSPVVVSFARIFGAGTAYNVSAVAIASLTSSAVPGCIIGLATSGHAIETQGGATIDALECAVVGAGNVRNGGTAIRAKEITSGGGDVINDYGTIGADRVRFGGSFVNPSWNNNVPSADRRVRQSSTVVDPLADHLELGAARSLLGTSRAARTAGNPVTSAGETWVFGYNPSPEAARFRLGNSGRFSVPADTYRVQRLTVEGGVDLIVAAGTTLSVAGGTALSGNSARFGNGTYRFNGGFDTGSQGVTFGDGSLHIGSGAVSFRGPNRIGEGEVRINARVSVGGGSSIAIGRGEHRFAGIDIGGGGWMTLGAGDLDVVGGVSVGGDSSLIAGDGNVTISNPGDAAIRLSGSGRFFMGDGLFSADGHIQTEGGSRLVFGRTENHLVNGNLTVAGSVLFGAGRYTVAGNFANGTGGTTWPYTSPITGQSWGNALEGISVSGYDMAGVNVTFILGGTLNLAGGAKTRLIAPGVTTSGGAIADILVDSLTGTATNWGAGSQNTFAGAIHLPNSVVTMSGGNNTLSSGQCFTLIAFRVLATGGANAGTACRGLPGGSGNGGDVELVS